MKLTASVLLLSLAALATADNVPKLKRDMTGDDMTGDHMDNTKSHMPPMGTMSRMDNMSGSMSGTGTGPMSMSMTMANSASNPSMTMVHSSGAGHNAAGDVLWAGLSGAGGIFTLAGLGAGFVLFM